MVLALVLAGCDSTATSPGQAGEVWLGLQGSGEGQPRASVEAVER